MGPVAPLPPIEPAYLIGCASKGGARYRNRPQDAKTGLNHIPQDPALKQPQKRCKLSGINALSWAWQCAKTRYRRPIRRQRPISAAKNSDLTNGVMCTAFELWYE